MAYGSNQPWGLMAVKTINGSTWNGQTNQYYIKNGYNFSIFKGDPVYFGTDGYIHSLADGSASGGQNNTALIPAIGVFNGCSFTSPLGQNPIDPSSPGRPYYPANTITGNGLDISCDIIDDPSVVFNVQLDANGMTWSQLGGVGSLSVVGATGNTSSGVSGVYLLGGTVAHNNAATTAAIGNVRVLRFVSSPPNPSTPNSTSLAAAQAYYNVEVIFQLHQLAARSFTL